MKNKYEIRGNVTAIFVKKANRFVEVLIDTESLSKADSIPTAWSIIARKYIATKLSPKKSVYLHRLIIDCPDGFSVDHIDRNPMNNTLKNLRIVTHAENQQNKGIVKRNTSGVKGVHWGSREKKWIAEVMLNYKKHYVGVFTDIESAEEAIKQARIQLHPFNAE